jgi:hypothetical protein
MFSIDIQFEISLPVQGTLELGYSKSGLHCKHNSKLLMQFEWLSFKIVTNLFNKVWLLMKRKKMLKWMTFWIQ